MWFSFKKQLKSFRDVSRIALIQAPLIQKRQLKRMNKSSMVFHPAAAEWTQLEWMLQTGNIPLVLKCCRSHPAWRPGVASSCRPAGSCQGCMTARVWMLTPHANSKHQANAEQTTQKEREGFIKYFSNDLLSVFVKHAISPQASAVTALMLHRSMWREASTSSECTHTCLKFNSATIIFSFKIAWLQTAGFSASGWIPFSLHLQNFWVLWEFRHGPACARQL